MLLTSIFSFSHNAFKSLFQDLLKCGCYSEGLNEQYLMPVSGEESLSNRKQRNPASKHFSTIPDEVLVSKTSPWDVSFLVSTYCNVNWDGSESFCILPLYHTIPTFKPRPPSFHKKK